MTETTYRIMIMTEIIKIIYLLIESMKSKADLFSLFMDYYDYRIMLNVNAYSNSPVPVLERYHPSLDSLNSLSYPIINLYE